jgi:hypothetical protein
MYTRLSSIARIPLSAGIASTSALSSQAALALVPHAYASLQETSVEDASESDSVTVSFGGRLVMVPATDPADQLASQDEIRFDVVGPRVEVLDGKSGTRIVCTRLRYAVQEEFVEATGSAESPLRVTNPRMQLEGTRFFASLSKGEGRLDGAGRMSLGRGLARRVSLLLHRRLFDARIRQTSTYMDMAVLIILWVQLSLGLLTVPFSLGHADARQLAGPSRQARGQRQPTPPPLLPCLVRMGRAWVCGRSGQGQDDQAVL